MYVKGAVKLIRDYDEEENNMGFCVCGGSGTNCSFCAAPSVLNVLPAARVLAGAPMASIMDQIPMVNIMPFAMCSSPANPMVAAATAAALGILTPMPCIPVPTGPWMPGSPTVLVGGKPALTDSSQLICSWGGIIKITVPGIFTIQLK